ncbi:MAG: hypothetical protein QOD70_182 [Frankiales bacterium]|jgi:beta-glucanase (GH16 family)|nr:hypothetical protein [Frankiales bacterium]
MRTPLSRTRRFLGGASTLVLGGSAALQLMHHREHRTEHLAPQAVPAPVAAVPVGPRVPESVLAAESARRASTMRRAASRSAHPADAMPVGNVRGWRQVLAEDFTSDTLPSGWGTYSGAPGGNPNGWWKRSHVAVRGEDLHLLGDWEHGTFVTGGLMATRWASTYGKYEVRFKVSRAQGVAYALLLWPASGSWPSAGEIDFAEDAGGGARRGMTATLHYGAGNAQLQKHVKADFTQFQTVGVEWTRGQLVYTLNGKPWATVISPHVPSGPMRLAMQLEAGRGNRWSPAPSRATPRTVDMVIDWVVGYRRA